MGATLSAIFIFFLPYFYWCCVVWLVHLVPNMSDHVFHKFRLVDKTCTISCWHCPSTKKKISEEKKRVGNILFIWRTWQLVIWKSKPRARGCLGNTGWLLPLRAPTVEVNSIWKRCDHTSRISQSLGIVGGKLYNQGPVIWEGKRNSGDDMT